MRIFFIVCFVAIRLATAQSIPHRVADSPYPVSERPDTLFIVEDSRFNEAQRLTIVTLQGLLAKNKPRLYRIVNTGSVLWLQDLIDQHRVTADSSYLGDFVGLIDFFKEQIPHYILCDPGRNSCNAAISLAGIFNAICVTAENISLMETLNIPLLLDLRDKDELWVYQQYDSLFNKRIVCYQKEEKYLFLSDYAIFSRAYYFFDHISGFLTSMIFARMRPVSAMFGWGADEYRTVAKASRHSLYVHPSDWAINLSTLTNFDVDVHQNSRSDSVQTLENVHTVCFYMTDGDNIIWILNDFATSNRWFANPNRGRLNFGWTISPALCELAPTVMDYLYRNAACTDSAQDEFIAGASGLGYMYPDKFPDLDDYASLMGQFMQKADLRIVNIIGDDPSEQYLRPYLQQDNIDAVFFNYYSDYSGLKGKIAWVNGKPVIGARYNLWAGFETPASLAEKLNALPRDPHSAAGYSLIPVHAWSNTPDSVMQCVRMLDEQVRVVAPSEFVGLIRKNLAPSTPVRETTYAQPGGYQLFQNAPNPFNSSTVIKYFLPENVFVNLTIYNRTGQVVDTLVNQKQSIGLHAIRWDAKNYSSGIYYYKLVAGEFTRVKKLALIR